MSKDLSRVDNKAISYEQAYLNLTSIQQSYGSIAQYLNRKIGEAIPSSLLHIEEADLMEKQILIANESSIQLEELKYYCSISFLTNGVKSSEAQLTYAIEILDNFLIIIELELKAEEAQVRRWALIKKEQLSQIKSVFIALLSSKIDRQINLGRREVH